MSTSRRAPTKPQGLEKRLPIPTHGARPRSRLSRACPGLAGSLNTPEKCAPDTAALRPPLPPPIRCLRRSWFHPTLAEDLFAGQLFRHALLYELANPLFLSRSEPSEPSELRIRIPFHAGGLLRRVLVFGFTRFTTVTTTRRIRLVLAEF